MWDSAYGLSLVWELPLTPERVYMALKKKNDGA